ncbi:MAG: hypothetical protein ACC660_06850, partial [Acidimicrobiales bacterium]
ESDWVVEEIARLDQPAPVESVEPDAGEGPDIVSMEQLLATARFYAGRASGAVKRGCVNTVQTVKERRS